MFSHPIILGQESSHEQPQLRFLYRSCLLAPLPPSQTPHTFPWAVRVLQMLHCKSFHACFCWVAFLLTLGTTASLASSLGLLTLSMVVMKLFINLMIVLNNMDDWGFFKSFLKVLEDWSCPSVKKLGSDEIIFFKSTEHIRKHTRFLNLGVPVHTVCHLKCSWCTAFLSHWACDASGELGT